MVSRATPSSSTLSSMTCCRTISPLPSLLSPQMAISSSRHDSASICGSIPKAAKISLVVLLSPSAWPRGVGPGFLSTRRTRMPEFRNQLASVSLNGNTVRESQQKGLNLIRRDLTYPAGPAPMIRTSTVVIAMTSASRSTSDSMSHFFSIIRWLSRVWLGAERKRDGENAIYKGLYLSPATAPNGDSRPLAACSSLILMV